MISIFKTKLDRIIVSLKFKKSIVNVPIKRLGNDYGGWNVPIDYINNNSICYCFGVGEDVSLEQELLSQFKCKVYSFDPTPKAIKFITNSKIKDENFRFFQIGIWESNEIVKFYSPKNKNHVSHSIVNIQKTNDYFEAECKTLKSIMSENHHDKIDFLKIDIEGAERRVIENIIKDNLNITILCVEIHYNYEGTKYLIETIVGADYNLISIDKGVNFTFMKKM